MPEALPEAVPELLPIILLLVTRVKRDSRFYRFLRNCEGLLQRARRMLTTGNLSRTTSAHHRWVDSCTPEGSRL
jgi:hypothetical protein